MTRLVDLKPHWIAPQGMSYEGAPRFYIGVSFLHPNHDHSKCPTCGASRERRLAVNFWPPIDPDGWEHRGTPVPHEGFHHRVSGDTFETLTLSPSIGLDALGFHGHITEGEVTQS